VTGPFAKAHTLTILMAMAEMSISCGSDVARQAIVRGASSQIAQLGYAALFRHGSFTSTGVRVGGTRSQPTRVRAATGA
jgi:hypothetical protein